MLPSDEEKIASQVEEAESLIKQEIASLQADEQAEETEVTVKVGDNAPNVPISSVDPETVGSVANQAEPVDSLQRLHANSKSPSTINVTEAATISHDPLKEHADDGGEVVLEADEDTVIY